MDRDPETTWGYCHKNAGVRKVYYDRLRLALNLAPSEKGKKILDAGTGSGFLLPSLAMYGDVTAVDHSQEYLDRTEKLIQHERLSVPLFKASVLDLPFADESFDLVFCLSVMEHIHDLSKAVGELKRVLKKDGVLMVGVPIERFAVNTLFSLFGVKSGHGFEHVSDFTDVEKALRGQLIIESSSRLPKVLPESLCLYKVFKCRRML